ncbi:MAG: radical SAM domain-containing protein, partial [Actinomycetota bacterium]|nr:radical SAM domain-containing protein [Actinomycetota bacterium]
MREVDRQMALLRERRGPGQNAQLIGGEVTLLEPDDHAAALQAMIDHGRKPMSMTHGDFDYDYLEVLALDPRTGAPRFKHLSFAGHF